MAEMTEQDETILSAMIEQHDPRTAERVLELMDDIRGWLLFQNHRLDL